MFSLKDWKISPAPAPSEIIWSAFEKNEEKLYNYFLTGLVYTVFFCGTVLFMSPLIGATFMLKLIGKVFKSET